MKIVITDESEQVLETLHSLEEIVAFLRSPGPDAPTAWHATGGYSDLTQEEKDQVLEQTLHGRKQRSVEYLMGAIAAGEKNVVSGYFLATLVESDEKPEEEIQLRQVVANPAKALKRAATTRLVIMKNGKRIGVLDGTSL